MPQGQTGTVYALIDPRNGITRYIGQTKQSLAVRVRNGYAPRVRTWMAELREAGLAPQVIAVRENVPAADLRAAEDEEITRIIAAGGTLLNEQVTARGRKMLGVRLEAERTAAERAAWAEVSDAARAVLGGPMPPGELPLTEIPDAAWRFMTTGGPARMEHARSLIRSAGRPTAPGENYAPLQAVEREREEAAERLQGHVRRAWGHTSAAGGDSLGRCLERNTRAVLSAHCASRENASRFLGLAVWYAVAVHPWRHLAEMTGMPLDDISFIAWAGCRNEVREALAFLSDCGDGVLERLSVREHCPDARKSPGRLLGAVAAAYAGVEPPEAIRSEVVSTLGDLADDHQMTQPMADLLMRLNPLALDAVFGKDVAAEMDRELSLPEGTSGRVLRALIERAGYVNDGTVRRMADRSAQALPMTSLPDYGGWYGPGIPVMRSVSGCLVQAGLAVPDHATPEEYLADVRALWTPDLERLERFADERAA